MKMTAPWIVENLGFDRVEALPIGKTIYYTTDGTDPRLPGGGILAGGDRV